MVVLQRLGHAFPNGLVCGEVDHTMHIAGGEHTFHRGLVAAIDAVYIRHLACDLGNAHQRAFLAVAEVINNDRRIACTDKLDTRMRADEPGAAGDDDFFHAR